MRKIAASGCVFCILDASMTHTHSPKYHYPVTDQYRSISSTQNLSIAQVLKTVR